MVGVGCSGCWGSGMAHQAEKKLTRPDVAEWFDGNQAGADLFFIFEELLHTWDDLVDKDKPVTEIQINRAFLLCLVRLPLNPVYQRIQLACAPLWLSIVAAYECANEYERRKDRHGLEIAHNLRYAAGHIITMAMQLVCSEAHVREHLPAMWKAVCFERFDDYLAEHHD